MENKKLYQDRWATEIEAAQHYKLKPSTLRKRRSKYGHDDDLIWTKVNGKILYDIWGSDQKIEKRTA
jgi:hypothetical protein|tara:strand:- start:988 stop:1188 length:201 start_codon:yes stop_codon:yes gene_type:complete